MPACSHSGKKRNELVCCIERQRQTCGFEHKQAACVSAALFRLFLFCAARDRLFEAGFDDDVPVSWLGQAVQMPTSAYSQYLAVAVVAGLGVAGGWAVGWWRGRQGWYAVADCSTITTASVQEPTQHEFNKQPLICLLNSCC